MNQKILLFSFIFIVANPAIAQQNIYPQSLYWLRYQLHINFTQKLYWSNEIDNRRFFNPDVQNQLIFHSRLHFKKAQWNFAAGLTFSNAYAQRPELGYKNITSEVRPVAEAAHELNRHGITLQNRLRIDNRFFEVNEHESIWQESRYLARLRYRLQLKIPLIKQRDKNPIDLRIADEIMFNSQENIFDQNRFYLTGDFYVNRKVSLEAGYIYIYQQRFGTQDFFSRHILRFSLLHRVNPDRN